jgi:hypothetical protein
MADPIVLRAFTPVTTRIGDHPECTCPPDEVTNAEKYYAGELHQVDCTITDDALTAVASQGVL